MSGAHVTTNRTRLAARLARMSKLVALGAPRLVVLGEWRLVVSAQLDCEQYGYDVNDSHFAREAKLAAEIAEDERKHQAHLDGRPVEGCLACEYEHPDAPEVMP